jgi:hypothetical protein
MFTGWRKIRRRVLKKPKRVNRSYVLHKETARTLLRARLEYFNQHYKHAYSRVAIRDQRRCWGSCSSKGNLNFSYKLLFLPPCLRDYVVVHELCHLRVLNHSTDFWMLVAEVMPDYAERALALRVIERTKGTALAKLQKLSHDQATCEFCIRDGKDSISTTSTDFVVSDMKDFLSDDVVMEVT